MKNLQKSNINNIIYEDISHIPIYKCIYIENDENSILDGSFRCDRGEYLNKKNSKNINLCQLEGNKENIHRMQESSNTFEHYRNQYQTLAPQRKTLPPQFTYPPNYVSIFPPQQANDHSSTPLGHNRRTLPPQLSTYPAQQVNNFPPHQAHDLFSPQAHNRRTPPPQLSTYPAQQVNDHIKMHLDGSQYSNKLFCNKN
eukprot:GHVL01006304.1.p1 GENE.GHVL01006304.1~~GHVL01006304.1.p1  ORF type:complete len:198 (+),score=36.50 GHVL01006304.1:59-652(+)